MTGPITFLPIPSPVLDDTADGGKAFNDVARIADLNFAGINGYLGSPAPRMTWYQGLQNGQSTVTGNSVGYVVTGTFPAFSFTLPTPCAGMLVLVSAFISAMDASNSRMTFSADFTGTGLVTPIAAGDTYAVGVKGHLVQGTRTFVLDSTKVVAGGTVTVTPKVSFNNANNTIKKTYTKFGTIRVMAMTGL